DPYWKSEKGNYFNTTDILGFSYYNTSDFDIADYSITSDILGWSYYNSTDFNIDDYLLNTGDTAIGNYTFDTDTFHIDSTNDRIGIGTTSPAYLVDFGSAASGARDIGWATATNARYSTIGTMFSSANLFLGRGVVSKAGAVNRLDYSTAVSLGKSAIVLDNDGIIFAIKTKAVDVVDNEFAWKTTYARMIIDDNGNVGIGTVTPKNTLNVDGTFNITGLSYFGSNVDFNDNITANTFFGSWNSSRD
ncbi:unnamed protein product, partial [marine sediment metagenome]